MYEYIIGDLIILISWMFLFFNRKDLRKVMIFSSLLCTPLGFSDYFFLNDYWSIPTLFNLKPGIESFLFALLIGGVSSALYKTIFKKKLVQNGEKNKYALLIFLLSLTVPMIILNLFFRLDLIYDGIISIIISTILILSMRKDLIKESIIGGLLFVAVYFMGLLILDKILFPGFILNYWNLDMLTGAMLFSIPLEEILWGFSFGALWSLVYEFLNNKRLSS